MSVVSDWSYRESPEFLRNFVNLIVSPRPFISYMFIFLSGLSSRMYSVFLYGSLALFFLHPLSIVCVLLLVTPQVTGRDVSCTRREGDFTACR